MTALGNAAALGFTNTTDPCFSDAPATTDSTTGCSIANVNNFIYWNNVHPSGHEPSTWAMMLIGYAGYRRARQLPPIQSGHQAMYDVWRSLEGPVVNPTMVKEAMLKAKEKGAVWDAAAWSIIDRAITIGRHSDYDNSRDKPCLMDQTASLSQSKSVGKFTASSELTPR